MLFYYIRHADPIYNPDSITPLGERQAEALAHRLANRGIDRIYASSSNRAQLTAKPTAEICKKEVTVLDWANEGKFFAEASTHIDERNRRWMMHQKKYRDLFNSAEMRKMGDEWYTHPMIAETGLKGGLDRVGAEADALFASLGYEHDRANGCFKAAAPTNERVALFAHQGFGIAFLSHILDIPYYLFCTKFDLNTSSMTVINFEGTGDIYPSVLTYSNDSHLWRDGLPTEFLGHGFI